MNLKVVNGFVFPADDLACSADIWDEVPKLQEIMARFCKRRMGADAVAIQAGGNVGVFAKELAKHFGCVYTFEPDPTNFHCLALNVGERNVYKLQAALGVRGMKPVSLTRVPHNCGATMVDENQQGRVPVMAIDNLNLRRLDLLYLDIEGMETAALQGALDTIERFQPIVVVENKGLNKLYGMRAPDEFLMESFPRIYQGSMRIQQDSILTPI